MSVDSIRYTSETLIRLLRANIDELNTENAIVASPVEIRNLGNVRLTLYLYSIVENPDLKNEDWILVNDRQSQKAPLSLDLYYLLTVYPDETQPAEGLHDSNIEAHRTLGRAMRVFYDNGILSGSMLQGTLRNLDQPLRLTLNPITVEDLTRIWSVFPETSYRPSVCYLVSPVRVDSEETTDTQRVVDRQLDHAPMVSTMEMP
jgi:Pvc16 N-terminal domain